MVGSPEFDAYQRFILSAKLYWTGPMFRALRETYRHRLSLAPKEMPPGPERVAALLAGEPDAQIFCWMERHLQRFKYSGRLGLVPAHEEARAAIEAALNAPLPPGLLELDPGFEVPRYFRAVDIHQHPGGIWSDEIAGAVYERGARSTTPLLSKDLSLHERFTDLVLALRRPRRLLDMGCGFGKSTKPFYERCREAEVLGIDIAAPCLKLAAQDAAAAQARNVAFKQRSADATRLPDGSFDLVTSTMMLHEMPPPVVEGTLREAFRLLEPGGLMIHLDFLPPEEDEFLTWIHYGHGRRNNEPYMEPLARMGIGRVMEAIGFREVRIEPFEEMEGALARRETHWRFPWAVVSGVRPAA
ncbi:MAG: class I SAM-dependent methyltransferase [Acetobacteraceae bacterium]|nr:class I SAM-dependent methyltransferase [Acetobacteraceae bacterium]MCX7685410.1 class I SAM-dependent methyltransferase [Acetobacteraceae bacterium]MDW8398495.1 class I SAM-dependent methyltransferase [Acetobacteraceae bacterium]